MAQDFNSAQYTLHRLMVDGNSDVFRYGLQKYDESEFEDPTYVGFTVEIDENTALFKDVLPFLEKYSTTRAELNARIPVYQEFTNQIIKVFKSQESVETDDRRSVYIKSHYINSISGLDLLQKKFIDWRKDKLSIELYEDIKMFSSYIASLYNNLTYSYENGRAMIPENLLKFNLNIKFSEIRNLTSLARLASTDPSDQQIAQALKNNVTCAIYKLYDCEFDMFNAKPFGGEIAQAGLDASYPGASVVNLDIYFKSVSRQMYNPLIKNAITMNDNKIDLGVVIVGATGNNNPSGQAISPQSSIVNADGSDHQEQNTEQGSNSNTNDSNQLIDSFTAGKLKKPSSVNTYNTEVKNNNAITETSDISSKTQQLVDLTDYNDGFISDQDKAARAKAEIDTPDAQGGIGANSLNPFSQANLQNIGNSIIHQVENLAQKELDKINNILQQKRHSLIRQFVNDVKTKVGVNRIIPDNVYTDRDFTANLLAQLASDIGVTGSNIINDITKGLTGH